jgi:hypothetical protein
LGRWNVVKVTHKRNMFDNSGFKSQQPAWSR